MDRLTLLDELNLAMTLENGVAAQEVARHRAAFDGSRDDITKVLLYYRLGTHAVFSHADAMVRLMQDCVVERIDDPALQVTPPHRKWLLTAPDRALFWKRLKLVVVYFPRLFGFESSIGKGTKAFQTLGWFIEARNSITHPHDLGDLYPIQLANLYPRGSQWLMFVLKEVLLHRRDAILGVTGAGSAVGEPPHISLEQYREMLDKTKELVSSYPTAELPRLSQFQSELFGELLRAAKWAEETREAWRRRAVTATLLSAVEGLCHSGGRALASKGLLSSGGTREIFSGSETQILNGVIELGELFSRVFGTGRKVERTATGAASFVEVLRLRNRFIHPRSMSDLAFDKAEAKSFLEGAQWIGREVFPLFLVKQV